MIFGIFHTIVNIHEFTLLCLLYASTPGPQVVGEEPAEQQHIPIGRDFEEIEH
jgi:hypothetical protein